MHISKILNVHCHALIPSSSSCLLLAYFTFCERKALKQAQKPHRANTTSFKIGKTTLGNKNVRNGDKILNVSCNQGAIASYRRTLMIYSPTNPFDIYIFDCFTHAQFSKLAGLIMDPTEA